MHGGVDAEDFVPLAVALEAAHQEIDAASSLDGVMTGVPTGFAGLDELMNGLHPGQLIVIAARPAIGKSTLASTSLEPRRSSTSSRASSSRSR